MRQLRALAVRAGATYPDELVLTEGSLTVIGIVLSDSHLLPLRYLAVLLLSQSHDVRDMRSGVGLRRFRLGLLVR